MKRATILHGTDGKLDTAWYPWLARALKNNGYEVFAPKLPDNHRPNRLKYEEFLKASGWDFRDNLLIGHSSGATTVLNLLSSDWFPKVDTAVLVGTFLNTKLLKPLGWQEFDQFDGLFLESYDAKKIRTRANKFVFVHGSNDRLCDIEDAKELCGQLGGTFLTVENGHHLGENSGVNELPQLAQIIGLA